MDFGVQNLKRFIQEFVPEVKLSVHSPTEVVYTLRSKDDGTVSTSSDESPLQTQTSKDQRVISERPNDPAVPDTRLPTSIWFALVNPASKKRVHVEQQTGQIRLEEFGSPLSDGWVRIEPLTAEDHNRIAREFSERVPSADRSRIDSLIGAGGLWWKGHYSALEELGLGLDYSRFHSRRVLETVDQILREKVGRGLKSLHLPDGRLVSAYVPRRPVPVGQSGIQRIGRPAKEDLLRSLAERLIRNMSRAELRLVKVSLGDLVDLL